MFEPGLSRREFLTLLAAATAPALGCGPPRLERPEPSGVTPNMIVDVHCHIFNAEDLPIEGFARAVLLKNRFGALEGPVKALNFVLQTAAPGYRREKKRLESLLAEEMTERRVEVVPAPDDLVERFVEHLENTEPESLPSIYREMGIDPLLESPQALDESLVDRVLQWAWILVQFRVENAQRLMNTYPSVDLFTPSLVDLDLWVTDQARTSVREQIELNGLIAQWSNGRIRPFVAYDPYREVLRGGDPQKGSLHWVVDAIESQGFVGVKLYPPMGFRALGNAELFEAGDRRRDLDTHLRALYRFCEDNQVPIMAHCNASNGADVLFGDRASPLFWRDVLEEFGDLHVNLGHFGGVDDLRQNVSASWAWEIGRLMRRYDRVYADTGFHGLALDATTETITRYFTQLKRVRDEFGEVVEDRLLYGSDWQMIVMAPNHERYLETYRDLVSVNLGDDVVGRFLGQNALDYLGPRVTSTIDGAA